MLEKCDEMERFGAIAYDVVSEENNTVARLRSPFATGPSPPRLPKEEQETFERLQRQSTGAFSTPRSDTSATDPGPPTGNRPSINQSPHNNTGSEIKAQIDARGEGQELHPDVRRGARPEFDGETNPKTGEVGGPKNEPLRWGGGGDWSYNGRVTDF
ncbi:MAG: putative mitochondrial protein, conserved [Bogoriella megaspora]|nr:MAG: putative mitochondrial protein, conserved [Bogoriella megaspora]